MMNRIDSKFKELRRLNKKALIIYLTCGFPDLATTERLVLEIEKRGLHQVVELFVIGEREPPLHGGDVMREKGAKGADIAKSAASLSV